MQIVIDIDEKLRERLFDVANDGVVLSLGIQAEMVKSIVNGTPLPKGHGRLIDGDALYNQTAEWEAQALAQVERYSPEYSREEWRWWSAVLKERGAFKRDLENAPTVLGADKESAE